MQTLADMRGWSPFVALQIEYSLVERTVEHELMPMAAALGLGVLPWSPLGGGVLAGKYSRTDVQDSREAAVSPSRKGVIASSGHLNERSMEIAHEVRTVAQEMGSTPSRVALAWTLANPTVVSPIMGARTIAQAEENLGALDRGAVAGAARSPEPGKRPRSDIPCPFRGSPIGSATHLRRSFRGSPHLNVQAKKTNMREGLVAQTAAFLALQQPKKGMIP